MENKEQAQMVLDFEEEIQATIVPMITRLLGYAFQYGYEVGKHDYETELGSYIINSQADEIEDQSK